MLLQKSEIREKLALAYRILAYLGLDDHTYTHLSARSEDGNSFYIYPFGLCFSEVEPENLMKVTFDGDILEGAEHQYNRTGYVIHGNIYKVRTDLNCIFHLHTTSNVAVSVCEKGLMPLSQWALHFYNKVSYHNYNSLALDNEHGSQLLKDLADKYVMLLRGHGSITAGRTIEETMFYTYHLEKACETQCKILAMNQNIIIPSHEICEKSVRDLLSFEKNLGERDWHAWIRLVKKCKNS